MKTQPVKIINVGISELKYHFVKFTVENYTFSWEREEAFS